jgi:hypothetical protein
MIWLNKQIAAFHKPAIATFILRRKITIEDRKEKNDHSLPCSIFSFDILFTISSSLDL